jgi:hypothetical protein
VLIDRLYTHVSHISERTSQYLCPAPLVQQMTALAEGTASVEPAGEAERAMAAKPDAFSW